MSYDVIGEAMRQIAGSTHRPSIALMHSSAYRYFRKLRNRRLTVKRMFNAGKNRKAIH